MKQSYFNFLAAIVCSLCAAFGNPDPFFVGINLFLALFNLGIGYTLYGRGQ